MKFLKPIALLILNISLSWQLKAQASLPPSSAADSPLYISQRPGETLAAKESTSNFNITSLTSIVALAIASLAIYLPIRSQQRSNKRILFFQFYDRWNSQTMFNNRKEWWEINYSAYASAIPLSHPGVHSHYLIRQKSLLPTTDMSKIYYFPVYS